MSNDPNFGFVIAAYAFGFVIVAGMTGFILFDYLNLKKALSRFAGGTARAGSERETFRRNGWD